MQDAIQSNEDMIYGEKLVQLVGGAQDFLSLSKHVQVHGREEGDVEEHDAEDDQGEVEGDVESIWKVDREKVLLAAFHCKIFSQF